MNPPVLLDHSEHSSIAVSNNSHIVHNVYILHNKHIIIESYMSDSNMNETNNETINVGGVSMTRTQLKSKIAELKAAQDAEKKLILADMEPLQKRKTELEEELAKVHNSRKPELDELQAKQKAILDEVEEESKPMKEELTGINKQIEEFNQDLQEIGVLERVSRKRGERKTTDSSSEGWKSRVGTPMYVKYVDFFKRHTHIASLQAMKSEIRADPAMGGYGNDGLNKEGTGFSGSGNYVWIAVRKENLVRWNDDGSIDFIGQ